MQVLKTEAVAAAKNNLTAVAETIESLKASNVSKLNNASEHMVRNILGGEPEPSVHFDVIQNDIEARAAFLERLELTAPGQNGEVTVTDVEYSRFIAKASLVTKKVKVALIAIG